ncbi:MAG: hypothetical protein LBF32_01825 [Streptococcaceae bacterium]|nr:hypothetical protein [Streptococcaceae bacterium]
MGNSESWVNIFIKAFVAHAARYPEVVNRIKPHNASTAITEVGFADYMSYINRGLSYDSMAAIIGNFGNHDRINITNSAEMAKNSGDFREAGDYSNEAISFFNDIKDQLTKRNALTTAGGSVYANPATGILETKGYSGFRHNHEYAILDTLENQTTDKQGNTRKLNLIQIQNPWGTRIPYYQKEVGNKWVIADADTNLGTDGICWVDLNDFLRFFVSIDFCKLNVTDEAEANQRLQEHN